MKKKSFILLLLDLFQVLFTFITICISIYIILANRIILVDTVFYGIVFMSFILFIQGLLRSKDDYFIFRQNF